MRLPLNPVALTCAILFSTTARSLGLACNQAVADGVTWDLSKLGGPRSVMHSVDEIVSLKNTTYTIDICQGLVLKEQKSGEKLCPFGSRVCAMERIISDNTSILERGWPIAGELKEHSGGHIDEKWERLKTSSSYEDSKTEGVRLEMNGGFSVRDDGKKRAQKAVIEFICDESRNGTENLITPEDEYVQQKSKRNGLNNTEITPSDAEDDVDFAAPSLVFKEYNQDREDVDVLHLSWRTKYACENASKLIDHEESHWGFFTWFIIIAFLTTASYLIFGSWLNYNRYGARGWDLLPHSDTIRDVPYLFKDWFRRAFNTIQGGGSRAGYVAV
ncbi:hypothetical protein K3495_g5215 [Podosphaera aphanis]|nr:hypothetical protein K3495_g5215 [Podosphaera aphanis]